MNNYPAWWDSTITLYNKYEDPTTHAISWYRTVLHNCFVVQAHDLATATNEQISGVTFICRIPKNPKYLSSEQWVASSNKSDYFTVRLGDIIVFKEVNDVINEYTANTRSSDLLSKYRELQGCCVVNLFTDASSNNRQQQHYAIRGI